MVGYHVHAWIFKSRTGVNIKDFGYRYLEFTRLFRSIALIYTTIAMPLYLVALHVNIVYIGLVVLSVMLFNIGVTFTSGMVGDRIGYKYSLLIAETLAFLGITVLAFSTNIYMIVIGIIISGVSGSGGAMRGSMSSGLNAFIANNWKENEERARKLAGIFMFGAVGSVIGSSLLYFNAPIKAYFGTLGAFRVIFMLSAVLLLISIVLLMKLEDSERPKKTTKVMKIESLKYSLRVMGSNMITGMGIGLAIPLMPLWFELTYKLNTTQLSYIFIIYYAVAGIGSVVARRIVHRVNLVNMASITRTLNGLFLIVMALSPFAILSAFMYELFSFSSSLGVPSRSAVNIRGINKEDYGTASTIQGISITASQLTSGLSGALLEYSLELPLLAGGALQAIGGLAYKRLMSKSYEESNRRDKT